MNMTTEQKLEIETWEKEFYAHKCNLLLALVDDIKQELEGMKEELKSRHSTPYFSTTSGITTVTGPTIGGWVNNPGIMLPDLGQLNLTSGNGGMEE
jgi:hypothetical protein